MVTTYYLAIQNITAIKSIIPSFGVWIAIIAFTLIPFSIIVGWLHTKKSKAYSSELDVLTEANPYYYKLPPGYNKEVLMPLYLELLNLNIKILNKEELTDEDRKRIEVLKAKMDILLKGESVGKKR